MTKKIDGVKFKPQVLVPNAVSSLARKRFTSQQLKCLKEEVIKINEDPEARLFAAELKLSLKEQIISTKQKTINILVLRLAYLNQRVARFLQPKKQKTKERGDLIRKHWEIQKKLYAESFKIKSPTLPEFSEYLAGVHKIFGNKGKPYSTKQLRKILNEKSS